MADIKVRVGQQNSIKVISSLSGQSGIVTSTSNYADYAQYAAVAGITSNVTSGLAVDAKSLNVTGISTFAQPIKYEVGYYNGPNGIAYFNNSGQLISGANANSTQNRVNGVVLTINDSGSPVWSNVIDGGFY